MESLTALVQPEIDNYVLVIHGVTIALPMRFQVQRRRIHQYENSTNCEMAVMERDSHARSHCSTSCATRRASRSNPNPNPTLTLTLTLNLTLTHQPGGSPSGEQREQGRPTSSVATCASDEGGDGSTVPRRRRTSCVYSRPGGGSVGCSHESLHVDARRVRVFRPPPNNDEARHPAPRPGAQPLHGWSRQFASSWRPGANQKFHTGTHRSHHGC